MTNQRPVSRILDLKGLRVLTMLPSATEERADYLVRLLSEMKERWDWRISVLCPPGDLEAFQALVEPHGDSYSTANYRKVSEWEKESEAVARIDKLLREAELAAQVPVGQLVLAAAANIGCSFTLPYVKQKNSNLMKRVLGDNTEPFRLYRRLYGFAEETLDKARPQLVIAYEWAKPWRSNIWMAAARRGIPCVSIRRSKLNGDHYYWTAERTLFNTISDELAERKRRSNMPISDLAREKIEAFRQRPLTVKFIRDKWEMLSRRSWLKWHREWARGTVKKVAKAAVGRGKPGKLNLGQIIEYNRRIVQTSRDKAFFASYEEAELASMKYIYFPMHKETDLPLVFQTPRWHDQRNTIHVLAGSLPFGYRLFAREHRFNVGLRPAGYYEEMSRLPNVQLIDPFGDQFDYIRNASLVVTENGASGWEGLLFHRPTITLSRTVYDGAALARKVADPDAVGAAVLKAITEAPLDRDEHERRLGWMMDAEIESTFSMKVERVADGANSLEAMLSVILRDRAGPAQPAPVTERVAS